MAAAAKDEPEDEWGDAGWSWEDGAADEEEDYSGEPKPEPDADAAISRPGPEAAVMLVDCGAPMFVKDKSGQTLFSRAIRLIHKSLMDQMARRSSDLVSIVFFGTKTSKNSNDYDHVYVLNELDAPGTDMVAALERLVMVPASFDEKIGWGQEPRLHDAFWQCKFMFTRHTGKLSSRQILVLTASDQPYTDSPTDKKLRDVVLQRTSDAKEANIDINVIPLCTPTSPTFDVGAFYGDVITAPAPEPLVLGGEDEDPDEEAVHLEKFKAKVLRRRPTMVIPFSLCEDGPRLGVRVYALRKIATKSTTVPMLASDQIPLSSKVRYSCETTGKMIRPEELYQAAKYGGEKVVFTQDEVRRLKRLEQDDGSSRDIGLMLIGFKPRDRLKRHFNVKTAQFLYPDESVIRGSTVCFRALRDSCIRLGKVAVCRLIGSRSAEPRFVMLNPTVRGDGAPTGFHMVYLPYKDDMRKPQTKIEPCKEPASEKQVAAVGAVIDKLTSSNFDSRRIHNPGLGRFNKMLETIAFDRDAYVPPEDETIVTEDELMERAKAELTQAAALLMPDDYDPMAKAKPAPKRKAPGAAGAAASTAKKAKVVTDADISNDEMKAMVDDSSVSKLKVGDLKSFCAQVGIKTTKMKKADLVDAIVAWRATA